MATKVDFIALGDQYLTNLNYIAHELTTERNTLLTELLKKVAEMKWKTDLHLNKTKLKVSSVVESLDVATTTCLKRLKRKAPQPCKEEIAKKRKDDDGHDDNAPSNHEGEDQPSKSTKAETSKPADLPKRRLNLPKPHKPRNKLF